MAALRVVGGFILGAYVGLFVVLGVGLYRLCIRTWETVRGGGRRRWSLRWIPTRTHATLSSTAETPDFNSLSPLTEEELSKVEVTEAKRYDSDLFVTIFNGSSKTVRGVEVYFLVRKPTDAELPSVLAAWEARAKRRAEQAGKPYTPSKWDLKDPDTRLLLGAGPPDLSSPFWGSFGKERTIPSKGSVLFVHKPGPPHPSLRLETGYAVGARMKAAFTDRD